MFDVIKAGLTPYEAEQLYPNDGIVLLFPTDGDGYTKGDVIFVGDPHEAYVFTEPIKPPDGYSFYMLQGWNLHEMVPIEVD
jgi:hypothetical protein